MPSISRYSNKKATIALHVELIKAELKVDIADQASAVSGPCPLKPDACS